MKHISLFESFERYNLANSIILNEGRREDILRGGVYSPRYFKDVDDDGQPTKFNLKDFNYTNGEIDRIIEVTEAGYNNFEEIADMYKEGFLLPSFEMKHINYTLSKKDEVLRRLKELKK